MTTATPDPSSGSLVRSYLSLRKAIGFIGIGLPFAVWLRAVAAGTPLQGSISQYYHTHSRHGFVGCLCAIAVFLWSYCGYDYRDKILANIASAGALGVAM